MILTYIAGYLVLCFAVGAVIVFTNFTFTMVALLLLIAAGIVAVRAASKPRRAVRHG